MNNATRCYLLRGAERPVENRSAVVIQHLLALSSGISHYKPQSIKQYRPLAILHISCHPLTIKYNGSFSTTAILKHYYQPLCTMSHHHYHYPWTDDFGSCWVWSLSFHRELCGVTEKVPFRGYLIRQYRQPRCTMQPVNSRNVLTRSCFGEWG